MIAQVFTMSVRLIRDNSGGGYLEVGGTANLPVQERVMSASESALGTSGKDYQEVKLADNEIVWIKKSDIQGKLTEEQLSMLGVERKSFLTKSECEEIFGDEASADCLEVLSSLLKDFNYRTMILETLVKIPIEDRSDLLEKAAPFIKDITDEYLRAKILEEIGNVPKENLSVFLEKAVPFIKDITHGYKRVEILDAIARIRKGEQSLNVLEEVVRLLKSFTDRGQLDNLLDAIHLPRDLSLKVLEGLDSLFKGITSVRTGFDIPGAIIGIPEDDRTDVLEKTAPFIKDIADIGGRIFILKAIAEMPKEERSDVLEKAVPFIKDIADGYLRTDIFRLIAEIPKDDRTDANIQMTIINEMLKKGESELATQSFFSLLEKDDCVEYLKVAIERFPDFISSLLLKYPEDMEKKLEHVSFESLTTASRISILPFLTPEKVKSTLSGVDEEQQKEWLEESMSYDRYSGSILNVLKGVKEANIDGKSEIDPSILQEFLNSVPIKALAALAGKHKDIACAYLPLFKDIQLAVVVPVLSNADLLEFLQSQPLHMHADFLSHATNSQKGKYIEEIPKHLSKVQSEWEDSARGSFSDKLRLSDENLQNEWNVYFPKIRNDVVRTRMKIDQLKNKLMLESPPEELKSKIEEKIGALNANLDKIEKDYNKLNKQIYESMQGGDEIPEEFIDEIMGTVMKDPVQCDSVNLDQTTWDFLKKTTGVNPFNRKPIAKCEFEENSELKKKIEEYLIEHPQESE